MSLCGFMYIQNVLIIKFVNFFINFILDRIVCVNSKPLETLCIDIDDAIHIAELISYLGNLFKYRSWKKLSSTPLSNSIFSNLRVVE